MNPHDLTESLTFHLVPPAAVFTYPIPPCNVQHKSSHLFLGSANLYHIFSFHPLALFSLNVQKENIVLSIYKGKHAIYIG